MGLPAVYLGTISTYLKDGTGEMNRHDIFMSKRKTRIFDIHRLLKANRNSYIVMKWMDFLLTYLVHRQWASKSRSYFIKSTSLVSFTLSTFGSPSQWKTYVGQNEKKILPEANGKPHIYDWRGLHPMRPNEPGNKRLLASQLYSAGDPLGFVKIYILGPLLKTRKSKQLALVFKYLY